MTSAAAAAAAAAAVVAAAAAIVRSAGQGGCDLSWSDCLFQVRRRSRETGIQKPPACDAGEAGLSRTSELLHAVRPGVGGDRPVRPPRDLLQIDPGFSR